MCAALDTAAKRQVPEGSAIELGLPGTFAARGVSVPFTTPALDGARARVASHDGPRCRGAVPGSRPPGAPIDLLLPNPSGKGGVYVIEWSTIPRLCCPTLFDRDLMKRIAALPALTPASVLGAVHRAGASGLAGEHVSEAAAHAVAAERQERLLAHMALLMALIRQGEERYGAEESGTALEGLERRAQRVVARFAADLALPEAAGESLGDSIERLAVAFGGVGLGPLAADGHLARVQRGVAELALDAGRDAASGCEAARLVELVAGAVARAGDALLRAARERAEDVPALLRDWSRDPDRVAFELARAEWLFDGWGRLVVARDRPLSEGDWRVLASRLPALPDEAAAWSPGIEALTAGMRRWQGRASPAEDWRMGVAAADLVAASEDALARQLLVAPVPARERGLAA